MKNTIYAQSKRKSPIVCIILYVFLGFFGGHRFYINGASLLNFIYAFSFAFIGVGFVFDFFLVWDMADDYNSNLLREAFLKDVTMRSVARKNSF